MSDALTRADISALLAYLMPPPSLYEVTTHWWAFIDHWQTLIAGLLALIAGVGTIWATRDAASRTIKATMDAADREVAAAQSQTAVAQRQIEISILMEKKRMARESYAFLAMLVAAAQSILEDIKILKGKERILKPNGQSVDIYEARQSLEFHA